MCKGPEVVMLGAYLRGTGYERETLSVSVLDETQR